MAVEEVLRLIGSSAAVVAGAARRRETPCGVGTPFVCSAVYGGFSLFGL